MPKYSFRGGLIDCPIYAACDKVRASTGTAVDGDVTAGFEMPAAYREPRHDRMFTQAHGMTILHEDGIRIELGNVRCLVPVDINPVSRGVLVRDTNGIHTGRARSVTARLDVNGVGKRRHGEIYRDSAQDEPC